MPVYNYNQVDSLYNTSRPTEAWRGGEGGGGGESLYPLTPVRSRYACSAQYSYIIVHRHLAIYVRNYACVLQKRNYK